MYYVSYIEEYPIYEPAEGGYYYAGERVVWCMPYLNWKKANRAYQKCRKEFIDEYGWPDPERVISVPAGGCGRWINPETCYSSRYIGEGARLQITRHKPENRGWHPYE